MDLAEAFGAINRAALWTTLYKKGIHVAKILHIRIGHQNARLVVKHHGSNGGLIENNLGVFQWFSINALLFSIYLEDMAVDYEALNTMAHVALRQTEERLTRYIQTHLTNAFKETYSNQTPTLRET